MVGEEGRHHIEGPGGGALLNKGRSDFQQRPEGEGVAEPLCVRVWFRRVPMKGYCGVSNTDCKGSEYAYSHDRLFQQSACASDKRIRLYHRLHHLLQYCPA